MAVEEESHGIMYVSMDALSTMLKGHESNTLYIIGNGFDLFHDLKTRYWDFHEWLVNHNYADDFVATMEKLFPSINDGELLLWKDFEMAMGKYQLKKVHDDFFQGDDDGFYNRKVAERVVNRIKPQLDRIPDLLRMWIKSIPVMETPPRLNLSNESVYLSFNYTLVLENVYDIPSRQVIHMHNSMKDNNPLITGHGEEKQVDESNYGNANVEESLQLISDEMYELRKPVDNIIANHQGFFDALKRITHIVVFGLSLSEIDILYFKRVAKNVHDDAKWYFVVHDNEARENYEAIVKKYCGYFSRPDVCGASLYQNKIKPENCTYICTDELINVK